MDLPDAAIDLVVSGDGTPIAYERSGAGSPLVLVHGTSGDHSGFRLVEPLLAAHFMVYAVDRRGRGRSGDSKGGYAIEQEFADIAAVVGSLGEPVDLMGHSYGATVALGAALRSRNVRRLVLYEPVFGEGEAPELLARFDASLARDEREEVLSSFLVEVIGLGPEELEQFRASPLWAPRVAAAHTIPREIRAEEQYEPDPDALAAFSTPVTLLLGDDSPGWARRGTEVVHAGVPSSRVVPLRGQGHLAIVTAPELVVTEVVRFLSDGRAVETG